MFRGQTWPESESSAREQGRQLNETMIYSLFANIPQSYQPYIFLNTSENINAEDSIADWVIIYKIYE